jgi:hypothetical protein
MISGTIYKITSTQTPRFYIGSTIQSLSRRLAEHKYHSKRGGCTSKLILQYDDAKIEKLYDIEVETINELREIERNEVMANKDNVVNKNLTRTKKEIQKKKYKIQNEKRIANNPNYHSEHYNKYQKAYRTSEEYKAKMRLAYQNKKNKKLNIEI